MAWREVVLEEVWVGGLVEMRMCEMLTTCLFFTLGKSMANPNQHRYAAESEANNASSVAQGEGGMHGAVKDSSEMSSKKSMSSQEL